MRPCAWSMRLTKMRCGMPSSSSARSAGCGERRSRRIGIDDDDGDVGDRQRLRAVGRKADRSGHVEDGEIVAEIFEIVEVEFGRAAALARFRARIADAGAVGRRPQSVGGAGCEQHRFGKAGLSRAGGSHQRDYSSAFWMVVRPCDSPFVPLTGARVALREALGRPSGNLHRPPVFGGWQEGLVAVRWQFCRGTAVRCGLRFARRMVDPKGHQASSPWQMPRGGVEGHRLRGPTSGPGTTMSGSLRPASLSTASSRCFRCSG